MGTRSRFPNATTWAVAFLATLLAAALMSACATKEKPSSAEVAEVKLDDLKASVREVVGDEARARKVVALLDEMQAIVAAQSEALTAHESRIKALLADYTTSEADLRSEFAKFNASRTERALRGVEIAAEMRAATTADEWAGLHKARKKALNAVTNAARQN
jgi:hypothetical protein